LVVMSRWALIPVGLLVGSQLVYFGIKYQRLKSAKTDDERLEATINPATLNAFVVSVVIATALLISLKLGLLK